MPQERGWRPQGSDPAEFWEIVNQRIARILEVDPAPGPQAGPGRPGGPDLRQIPPAVEPGDLEGLGPQAP